MMMSIILNGAGTGNIAGIVPSSALCYGPGSAAHRFALRSVRGTYRERLRRLLSPHQIREPLEQIMRVARAWGGFGVVLHREYWLAVERDAAIGAIEQRDVGLRRAFRQR